MAIITQYSIIADLSRLVKSFFEFYQKNLSFDVLFTKNVSIPPQNAGRHVDWHLTSLPKTVIIYDV